VSKSNMCGYQADLNRRVTQRNAKEGLFSASSAGNSATSAVKFLIAPDSVPPCDLKDGGLLI
jgi:hypothetical protein